MEAVPKYKLSVTIEKKDVACYFSQLDLQRLYIRALRRADIPIWYSQGFNPHPKISYGNALKLGVEGSLTVVFWLTEPMASAAFVERFGAVLPQGLRVLDATYAAVASCEAAADE